MIRDVAITGEHQNAFTEWVRRSDELEAAYVRRFGEPLVMTEPNAGLEWLKRFLQNDPIVMTSDTRIGEAVGAAGQETPPTACSTSTRSTATSRCRTWRGRQPADRPDARLLLPDRAAALGQRAEPERREALHGVPHDARGLRALGRLPRRLHPQPGQVPFEGDMPFAWWEERLWGYDLDFAAQNRGIVLDTWLRYAQR
jgi:iron(III) transport system substrate-binding protein